ncbi:hypothetical protein ACFFGH_13460 [Lysobacter korlensis]|uniref:SnoaL-like domain-containing protein n=1 Tax=Lysobacter korlensis TaxID=553636 RepID=A0ABV6RPG8_9GAMM
MRLSRDLLMSAILATLLAACGADQSASPGVATPDGIANEALPSPAGAPGSAVTGMPDEPGPNGIRDPDAAVVAPEVALDADGNPLPPDAPAADAVDPATQPPATSPTEPVPVDPAAVPTVDALAASEAVAVVREYHDAINGNAYGRAYMLWGDGGQASGQSAQQFADGFAAVDGMSVEIAPPTRADAAMAQVPVTMTLRRRDGSERRLVGHYVLRRADGDPAAGWRIAAARLREGAP